MRFCHFSEDVSVPSGRLSFRSRRLVRGRGAVVAAGLSGRGVAGFCVEKIADLENMGCQNGRVCL